MHGLGHPLYIWKTKGILYCIVLILVIHKDYIFRNNMILPHHKTLMFHTQLSHGMNCKGLIEASIVETWVYYVLNYKGHYNWLKVQLSRCVSQPTSIKSIDSVLGLHSSLGYLLKSNMHGAQLNVDCEKIHIRYHIHESPYCN